VHLENRDLVLLTCTRINPNSFYCQSLGPAAAACDHPPVCLCRTTHRVSVVHLEKQHRYTGGGRGSPRPPPGIPMQNTIQGKSRVTPETHTMNTATIRVLRANVASFSNTTTPRNIYPHENNSNSKRRRSPRPPLGMPMQNITQSKSRASRKAGIGSVHMNKETKP